jgi:hypothetical protein
LLNGGITTTPEPHQNQGCGSGVPVDSFRDPRSLRQAFAQFPILFMESPLPATAAFGLTGLKVAFSLISLQAETEPLWGAFAKGPGFGAADAECQAS